MPAAHCIRHLPMEMHTSVADFQLDVVLDLYSDISLVLQLETWFTVEPCFLVCRSPEGNGGSEIATQF
jgi:hypothetical protein